MSPPASGITIVSTLESSPRRAGIGKAERLLLDGYVAFRNLQIPGTGGDMRGVALAFLVKLYEAQGRESDAARYRALMMLR